MAQTTTTENRESPNEYGGNGNYTYIIRGLPSSAPMSNPQFPTRHRATGEKAILEAIHQCDLEIVALERKATDPANRISVKTDRERLAEARQNVGVADHV